ncbi:MAG: hypothetical protein EOP04_14160, partial [Proteobacteria bacterium]
MKLDTFIETGALTVDAINNVAFGFHKITGLEGSRSSSDGSIVEHLGEFSETMSDLQSAFADPKVFNGVIGANRQHLIDRMRALQSTIDSIKTRPGNNELEKNQSLTNFAQSVAQVNEWMVTHNVLFRLHHIRTPGEMEEAIRLTDTFIAKIPSYEKTLDE